jgi:hypothetical protein
MSADRDSKGRVTGPSNFWGRATIPLVESVGEG